MQTTMMSLTYVRIILTLHDQGTMTNLNSLIIETDYEMVGKDCKWLIRIIIWLMGI